MCNPSVRHEMRLPGVIVVDSRPRRSKRRVPTLCYGRASMTMTPAAIRSREDLYVQSAGREWIQASTDVDLLAGRIRVVTVLVESSRTAIRSDVSIGDRAWATGPKRALR